MRLTETDLRILRLIEAGPKTLQEMMNIDGSHSKTVRRCLQRLRANGNIHSEPGEKVAGKPGPAEKVWCLGPEENAVSEVEEREDDELYPKRARGFGTNPPGEALVKAWQP
jgi:predicted ArsR family transcriptional regulator